MHIIKLTVFAFSYLLFHSVSFAEVTTLTEARASGDITVAPNGDIYISDFGNPSLRNGNSVVLIKPDGTQRIFAQNLPSGLAGLDLDPQGNLIQAAFGSGVVYRIDTAGNATTLANLSGPVGVVVDSNNVTYATVCNTNSIVKIATNGTVTVVAGRGSGGLSCPNGIDIGHDGALYVVNFSNGGMYRVGLNGGVSLFATIPGTGNGHVVYVNGHYYVTGRSVHRIFQVDQAGNVTPFAGTGEDGTVDGPNLEAKLSRPNGIGASPDGRYLYVTGNSDFNAAVLPIRRIDLLPQSEPFQINAGLAGAWYNPATDGQGFLVDVLPDRNELFVAWFTFADLPVTGDSIVGSAAHEWYVAQGTYQDNVAELELSATDGGIFDNPATVTQRNVGMLKLTFDDCTAATLDYTIDEGDQSGRIGLTRLTPDELCEVLGELE